MRVQADHPISRVTRIGGVPAEAIRLLNGGIPVLQFGKTSDEGEHPRKNRDLCGDKGMQCSHF
jgi:hypothetical protein